MNKSAQQSPRVEKVGWGKMKVEALGTGKDFKLWPGGGRPWNWAETGTAHSPGIQVADVEELVSKDCEIIILTRGMFSRLKIAPETLRFLESHSVETIVTDTKRGVRLYNDYIEQHIRVGALFHSTC